MNENTEELRQNQEEILKSIAPQIAKYFDLEMQIQNIETSSKRDMSPPNSNTMYSFLAQFLCSLAIFLRGVATNVLPCRDTNATPLKTECVQVDLPSEPGAIHGRRCHSDVTHDRRDLSSLAVDCAEKHRGN